jgi:tripartite-type tricarboxylate transporter receptor subunit TctC
MLEFRRLIMCCNSKSLFHLISIGVLALVRVISFPERILAQKSYPSKLITLITTQHIVMERIANAKGIKWSMVPFKSGSEPVLACLGGHVNAVAQGPVDLIPHIEAGKLRLILSLNDTRWKIAPNVPNTLEKYGFFGFNYKSIIGPKGMDDRIVEKIENAFKKAVDDPLYIQLCEAVQADRYYMSGKDYSKLWRSEYESMGKIIRDMGLGK